MSDGESEEPRRREVHELSRLVVRDRGEAHHDRDALAEVLAHVADVVAGQS